MASGRVSSVRVLHRRDRRRRCPCCSFRRYPRAAAFKSLVASHVFLLVSSLSFLRNSLEYVGNKLFNHSLCPTHTTLVLHFEQRILLIALLLKCSISTDYSTLRTTLQLHSRWYRTRCCSLASLACRHVMDVLVSKCGHAVSSDNGW